MRPVDLLLFSALAFVCALSSRNALAANNVDKVAMHLENARILEAQKSSAATQAYAMALYHDPDNTEALEGLTACSVCDLSMATHYVRALAKTPSESLEQRYAAYMDAY